MRRPQLVRVRQHKDGLWYPEVYDELRDVWVAQSRRAFFTVGYKRQGDAYNHWIPAQFEDRLFEDGTPWPASYKWAPGEEPKPKRSRKAKAKQPLPRSSDGIRLGEPICVKARV